MLQRSDDATLPSCEEKRRVRAAACGGCGSSRGSYLRASCTTVPAGVVEQRSAQALPQEPPVVPQLLWTQPCPSATALQQKLQLALPAGGDGKPRTFSRWLLPGWLTSRSNILSNTTSFPLSFHPGEPAFLVLFGCSISHNSLMYFMY